MNLFRSEEHIRNWSRFDPAAEQGIVPLANMVKLFSLDMFKKRLEPDYVARVDSMRKSSSRLSPNWERHGPSGASEKERDERPGGRDEKEVSE